MSATSRPTQRPMHVLVGGDPMEALPAYLRDRIQADKQFDAPHAARVIPVPPREVPPVATAVAPAGLTASPAPDAPSFDAFCADLESSLRNPADLVAAGPPAVPALPLFLDGTPCAERLTVLLKFRGRTRGWLVAESGVPSSTVYALCGGEQPRPRADTRAKLARALDVPEALLGPVTEDRGGHRAGAARAPRPESRRTAAARGAGTSPPAPAPAPAPTPPPAAAEEPPVDRGVEDRSAAVPTPTGLTRAHVDALARLLTPHLPPRAAVDLARQYPGAITVSADVGLAHEALERLRAAVGEAA